MITRERITQVVGEMKAVSDKLLCGDEDAYKEFEKYCADWMKVINLILMDFSAWHETVTKIPLDIIYQQIQNLEIALKTKDDFMLADTLRYEISNVLEYYLELVEGNGR